MAVAGFRHCAGFVYHYIYKVLPQKKVLGVKGQKSEIGQKNRFKTLAMKSLDSDKC